MQKKQKLPPEIIDLWPEVFEHVDLIAVPIDYVKKVDVLSTSGSTWEINLDPSKFENDEAKELVEDSIVEFIEEREEEIQEVLFEIDAEKVIKEAKEFSSNL